MAGCWSGRRWLPRWVWRDVLTHIEPHGCPFSALAVCGNLAGMNRSSWSPLTEPLSLVPQAIHAIHVALEVDDRQLDRLKLLLSPDEVARADRYKVPLPRRHFIACRATLRRLLATCLNCAPAEVEFDYGPHGKPSLRLPTSSSNPLQFSVSHSADQALIAVAMDRVVGIDLEQIDPAVRILKLADRFFSTREANELRRLPECDQLAGFYRGWTSKEAYLKATGHGLSFPLNKFSVALNPHQAPGLIEVVDQPGELTRWDLRTLDPIPGFATAVMFEAAVETTVRQWSLAIE